MKKTADIMGMPVSIILDDDFAKEKDIEKIFDYFRKIDATFSTYKKESEVSRINRGELNVSLASSEVKKVIELCEQTKKETNGFFNIEWGGKVDPSGIVKGYAIWQAGIKLKKMGYKNFCVEIAGDMEISGLLKGKKWRIGIENPFNRTEIVKILEVTNKGIATSGNYLRDSHIYNPINNRVADEVASVTVIADNIYNADRFATAAFAMGKKGIYFLEKANNLEGYMVLKNGKAISTGRFKKFVTKS
jgi:thiamine biosynthesis lipoprotein